MVAHTTFSPNIEYVVLSSKPCLKHLRSHKLSIWLTCAVMHGGMPTDLSDSNIQMNIICLFHCSWYFLTALKVHRNLFWQFWGGHLLVFGSVVYACGPANMAATLRPSHTKYYLWCSDWLKLHGDWQPATLYWVNPEGLAKECLHSTLCNISYNGHVLITFFFTDVKPCMHLVFINPSSCSK